MVCTHPPNVVRLVKKWSGTCKEYQMDVHIDYESTYSVSRPDSLIDEKSQNTKAADDQGGKNMRRVPGKLDPSPSHCNEDYESTANHD